MRVVRRDAVQEPPSEPPTSPSSTDGGRVSVERSTSVDGEEAGTGGA
jgi:hypothetical protein